MRFMLEENLKFGSHLKKLNTELFDKREGYHEEYIDTLPIIRDDIRDSAPEQ